MAKFAFATIHDNVTNTNGGFIMNFVRFFLNFFKSMFTTMFRKEQAPSRHDILSKEFEALHKENEILEEVRKLLRKGWPERDDPYTYSKVCDLIRQLSRDPDRYNGAEELNDIAGGTFYFHDKDCQPHEVPYQEMCEQYMKLHRANIIPRDWEKYDVSKTKNRYMLAMRCIQVIHLPKIKVHVEKRFNRNKERLDEILDELFGDVPAEA